MKWNSLVVLYFIISACEKEPSFELIDTSYPAGARLERIIDVSNKYSTEALAIESYEYDEVGKLQNIYNYFPEGDTMRKMELEYDNQDRLITKLVYNRLHSSQMNNNFIPIIMHSWQYFADSLRIEKIEYLISSDIEYFLTYFDDGLISHVKHLDGDSAILNYTYLHYDERRLKTKEEVFWDNKRTGYTEFQYFNGMLMKAFMKNDKGEVIREARYTYDKQGNLIIYESIEIAPWSSVSSFVRRYEYSLS